MHIPAEAFSPPPKVESALVRLVPKQEQPSRQELRAMERLTAAAFGQRANAARGAEEPGRGRVAGSSEDRPATSGETLSVAEFETLMRALLAREDG